MPKERYQTLNIYVMGIIYSPMLLVTSWFEVQTARKVNRNRLHNQADDDTIEEREQLQDLGKTCIEEGGWAKKVQESKPNVVTDAAVLEIRDLKAKLDELTKAFVRFLIRGPGQ